jgi:hypothetical protein
MRRVGVGRWVGFTPGAERRHPHIVTEARVTDVFVCFRSINSFIHSFVSVLSVWS